MMHRPSYSYHHAWLHQHQPYPYSSSTPRQLGSTLICIASFLDLHGGVVAAPNTELRFHKEPTFDIIAIEHQYF